MSLSLSEFATWASWAVSGLGLGLLAASFVLRADAVRRQRMRDCGVALAFGGVLTRVILQDQRTTLDWALAALSLIYIPMALWRLSRTQAHIDGRPE